MTTMGRLLWSTAIVKSFQTEKNLLSPPEWQAPLPVRILQPYLLLENHTDGDTWPKKTFDDIFIRFHTILECDRRTDSHVATAKTALCYASRGKKDTQTVANIHVACTIHKTTHYDISPYTPSAKLTSCARGDTMCPSPFPPVGAQASRAPPSRRNLAVLSYAEYVPTLTSAAALRVKAALSKEAWWPWPLTF